MQQCVRMSVNAEHNNIRIVEVGPRDGLQNEKVTIATEDKVQFIHKLVDAGLKTIEVTSFVSPKWVPQMADSVQVASTINREPDVNYCAIVPNAKGLQMASDANIHGFCVGTAASETFCQKNWNCSIAESMQTTEALIKEMRSRNPNAFVRGYISNVMGCPYEGDVRSFTILHLAEKLLQMGCTEISLGDTIGVGTPVKFSNLIRELVSVVAVDKVAVHCHDTYAQALPNILVSLEQGVRSFDSSAGGLGGCPYAPGAAGNVATEDLLYMLHGMGLSTGVDVGKVVEAAKFICGKMGRGVESKVGKAWKS